MSIEDQLKSLTPNEAAVLFWKCKGLKYEQIAGRLGFSLDWVQLQMSNVYVKLAFSKEMHWTKRKAILENDVCPKLPKDLKDWNFREETKEEVTEEPKKESVPNPEMMALVLYDEKQLATIPVVEGEIVHEEPSRPRNRVNIIGGFIILILVCIILYLIFRPTPPNPTPTATVPPATNIPAATLPFTSVPVIVPATSVPPTSVPPTEAPTPLPTPAFYEQGQPAILRDGVTVTLQSNFVDKNFGGCFTQNPGFVIEFLIHNSTGNQFLIRFDPAAFHAQDDSGTTYTLKGAGMYICNATGPQNYPGRSEEALYVSFGGQIPLSASYITITADSLSGVRLVFHKLL